MMWKIGIPDSILLKPGKLTAGEFEIMKTHALLGIEIVEDNPWLKGAAQPFAITTNVLMEPVTPKD